MLGGGGEGEKGRAKFQYFDSDVKIFQQIAIFSHPTLVVSILRGAFSNIEFIPAVLKI